MTVLGALVANLFLRFVDLLAAFDEAGAVTAVVRSATASRQHLASLAGFAGVVGVIRLTAFGVLSVVSMAAVGGSVRPSLPVVEGVLVVVVLNGISVTYTGTLHAAFATQHVRTPPNPVTPPGRRMFGARSSARVAVAVVLVLGLVTGATVVRSMDLGVHARTDARAITTDSPDVAVATAVRNTASRSHRQVLYRRNASDPGSSGGVLMREGIDYADRQRYTYFPNGDDETFGGFFGEGTLALRRSSGRASGVAAYENGSWSVMMFPAWGLVSRDPIARSIVPNGPTTGWEVVVSNESTLVVRVTDPDSIRSALGTRSLGGSTAPLANDSHVSVVIDRDRGVLDEVRFRLHSLETGENVQYRLEYRAVGSTDLERPAPIRDRRLLEHVWDAIYY